MIESIDIVIITYNCKEYTIKCIESIYENNSEIEANIIIVDNNSNDDSVQYIQNSFPEIKIIENPDNYGYAKAVNIGFEHTKSNIVIISNADIIYKNKSIQNLIETFHSDSNIAVAGPQQFFPDGKPQYCWGETLSCFFGLRQIFFLSSFERIFYNFNTRKNHRIIDVGYADGAVLAIKRDAFIEMNGFDEDYFFYTEEADFCYRVKKSGRRVVNNPKSEVIHFRGASTTGQGASEKSIRMLLKSKHLFCKKHLSDFETKCFFKLLTFYYRELLLKTNILSFLFNKDKYKSKKDIINKHLTILKEFNK